jgi:hypothetical protein
MAGGDLDQVLMDHLIVEFLDHGWRAVEFLRSASGLLSMPPGQLPRQPALMAYCLREAMKAIPASQDTGDGGQWRMRSRAVAQAKQRFEMIRGLPGEDSDGALQELLAKIDQMALTHEQDRLHQQRLIAVITNRTGAQPLAWGTGPVQTYQSVLDRLDTAVHGTVTLAEARQLRAECLGVLRQLFLPPDTRHRELDALTTVVSPREADVAALLALLGGPTHLHYFLSRIESTAWLELLRETTVLEPPSGQAAWPVFAAVEQLKDDHGAELAAVLARMFDRWGSNPQKAWYLTRAAVDLGSPGHRLVLRALRQHPTSTKISDLAVWAADKTNPADEFVQLVADQVLNASGIAKSAYLEPLLRALIDGITPDNYQARLKLLCYKLAAVPVDDHGRRSFNLWRGGSISDRPEPHRPNRFDALLHTLVGSLRRAAEVVELGDLLDVISPLPTDVGDRVRAWLLGQVPSAEPSILIAEVTHAIARREPAGDDLPLIDRVVGECDPSEYSADWAQGMGAPPSPAALGKALAAHDMPKAWLRAFEWSGVLPPLVTAAWATPAAMMAGAYGDPSRAALEQQTRTELSWAQSPLSDSDMRAMTPEDAARWIASWRPDPANGLTSARELGRTLETVVKADPAHWAASPLRMAGLLHHPTYIHHYLRGLGTATALNDVPTGELIDLLLFVRAHPWESVPLGRDSFDFDGDWRDTEEAGIDLIKSLADSDIGFGGRRDEVWSILQSDVERRKEPTRVVDGARDPLEAAINRPCTRALEAALSFMGHEYRTDGTVRPQALDLLSAILRLEGTDGAQHRAILAPRMGFLRHIAPQWVDAHRDELFGAAAPNGLGQVTVDQAVKWGRPNRWLLEQLPRPVRDAVRRDVDNALDHYLIAMLLQLPGYSVEQAVNYLRTHHKLAQAAAALGRLLGAEDVDSEHVRLMVRFWTQAIDAGTAEALAGFGWLSEIGILDDTTWTQLTLRTLTITRGRIGRAHKVAERAATQPPTNATLAILNELVRGLDDDWDRRSVTELAAQTIGRAEQLAHTPEYQRLRTTLLERGLLTT